MDILKVPIHDIRCDEDSAQDYINVLNGLIVDCARYGGYKEGYRNEMILDMTVSSYMLGLNPEEVLVECFMHDGLITNGMDDEQPTDRLSKMLDYEDRFDWNYMLDPDSYQAFGMTIDNIPEENIIPFKFQLVE